MGRYIPERIIEEVKFRNDIVDVVGQYVQLKRTGSTYKACCPFHKEKTPSFNVNPARQMFKCFGCGEGGNVISFLMKYQGLDFVTAVKALAERAGIALELEEDDGRGRHTKLLYRINREIAAFYQRCLEQARGAEAARKYLKERKLTGEIAEEFKLGYAPGGWDITLKWGAKHKYTEDQLEAAGLVLRSDKPNSRNRFYDRFRDRLMFPITDSQGRVVGFSGRILVKDKQGAKYINSPETDIFRKSRILYALDKARKHIVSDARREAVICEGQIDVIRCHQAGIKTAIASQGTAFTPEHALALKNYADSVVLAFDSDDAGRKAAIKTAVIFMDAGIIARIATLPPGEDPDSYILAKGAKAFRKLLDEAVSVIHFQIDALVSGERDLKDIATTARIAKGVLHTIAHSTNAVQKARLLQEASELLKLPISALEEDLKQVEAEERKIMERQKRNSQSAAARVQTTGREPSSGEAPPFYDIDEGEPIDELEAEFATAASGGRRATAGRRAPGPPSDEHLLCENIVHLADYPELRELVEEYLPLDMISTPKCRRLIEEVFKAAADNNDLLEELLAEGESAADILEYAEQLIGAPLKTRGREYSPREAVQDLILSIWRRKLQAERDTLSAKERSESLSEEDAYRKAQLTVDLNHLRRWESGRDVILVEKLNSEQ